MGAVRKYKAAEAFKALPLAARQKVEAAIDAHLAAVEALTGCLDQEDGNSDDEDDGIDEPSLGCGYNYQDLEENGDELEPSLGSAGGTYDAEDHDQERWSRGGVRDLEEQHDGSEYSWHETHGKGGIIAATVSEDDEPSL